MPKLRFRGVSALITSIALVCGVAATGAAAPPSAAAVERVVPASRPTTLVGFDAGNLMDDAVFFAQNTMSAADIQAFLDSKVPRCDAGYTCLKNFSQATVTRPADAMCRSDYVGRASESAASIIFNVAQACQLNPQVLLVTLQKEQGLVTHTWPSDWRYTMAMGQGCPDTAACDTRYNGFFNQVYGAAWQFKRYANPPGTSQYFTWYAPGRTWDVRYHPNASCGSSPVFIANQATANLYYYTPYQPNAASLRAVLGEGDGCSSYGNRNFYNYFTEWFGSTRGTLATLVRTAGDPAVYLLSGSSRWHVANGDDYADLSAAYGPAQVVSGSLLSGYGHVGTTGAVLRDASSGLIALVQGGQYHRLATCDAVAMFGASCSAPTNVSSALFSRIPRGEDVGSFFRVRGATTWGRFDGGTNVTPLYNSAAASAVNQDVTRAPYAPFLSSAKYATLTKGRTLFAPAQVVKSSADSKVYLTLDFDRLAWVTSWTATAEFNRFPSDLATVSPADLSGYREDGVVAQTITCDSSTYFPASGWLHRLSDPSRAGLTSMTARADTCRQFSTASATVGSALAVVTAGSPDVSVIEAGKRRAVFSWNLLLQHNGGTVPPVLTIAPSTLSALAEDAPIADGLVVKRAASPDLQFVDGRTLHWIPSGGMAADLGIALQHRVVSDPQAAGLGAGAPLGMWVACNGQPFFAASGRIWPTTAGAATGFAPVALGTLACAALQRESDSLGLVAVKTAGSPDVYVAENGSLRRAESWSALVRAAGGVAPRVLTITIAGLASIPLGSPVS